MFLMFIFKILRGGFHPVYNYLVIINSPSHFHSVKSSFCEILSDSVCKGVYEVWIKKMRKKKSNPWFLRADVPWGKRHVMQNSTG